MNPVEIEQALSDFCETAFDPIEFPYAFLACFGRKPNELRSLRSGSTNKSNIENAVLLRNAIHICVCPKGEVGKSLETLRQAPETAKWKARLALTTDGQVIEAENLITGETFACDYVNLADHFGALLTLAGIEATAEIRNNPIDIKATGRLNRLYIELLRYNEDWGTAARRHDLNQFITRLIFCFFAEDTGIFPAEDMFTKTIETMSDSSSDNTDSVISTLFRAMDLRQEDREKAGLPRWVNDFPYVNGALFSGTRDVPKFSRIARSYLIHAGSLDWKEINPDIFGSMIQAIADDEERGSVGMHYTSVPNILKVLNPLFLDSLRQQLDHAADNTKKLGKLKKRISRIRVFDPACGSGNFLVIAYKEMRSIEAEVNIRRNETHLRSTIPLSNFRGIEIIDFPTEIARLGLIIAEYQCDERYRSQRDALADFLPLDSKNWILSGNALRLDWLSVCPPKGTEVKLFSDDLLESPLKTAQVNFENEGGETYICGNPPYKGSKGLSGEQKAELALVWGKHPELAKTTDYVSGWLAKFIDYLERVPDSIAAFVVTNSVCQGQQAGQIWPAVFGRGNEIRFAHTSFKWSNLASHNAGVTVVVVGIGKKSRNIKKIYQDMMVTDCSTIGPYLVPNNLTFVQKSNKPIGTQSIMLFGNMPRDGGYLLIDKDLKTNITLQDPLAVPYIKRFIGTDEMIYRKIRYCIWIPDDEVDVAKKSSFINTRLQRVCETREESKAKSTRDFANRAHRFVQIAGYAKNDVIVVPRHSSENREYLPVDLFSSDYVIGDSAFALYDVPMWNFSVLCSHIHLVWIASVCGKLETRYRYSNTIGWNTFPIPRLTEKNRVDLKLCAEDILLAREAHFPKTLADLYNPDDMPKNLRQAHDRNDEVLERIYIGRTFKNDTERLEKLFELYVKMTTLETTA
ncbi:lactate dehydrogenase [Gammaproteobacteria bacterium]|nr:lactate dehydrogenase [Gammaproteobacteria bacterium]